MFISGRRKTAWLRGTAGLGVALMLSSFYRPAFGTTAGQGGPAAAASSPSAAATAPRPTEPPSARPDRVRSPIVPTALRLERGPGATGLPGGVDPWALFDGDSAVVFQAAQPIRVRVSLPGSVALEAIGVYGGKGAIVTVSAESPSGSKPIAGFERLVLDELPARWNRFSVSAAVEAPTLLLDVTPAPGQRAEIPELELWGRVAPSDRPATSRGWAEALLTHVPAGAVQVAASPSSATIAAPQVGPAGHVPLTFDLDRGRRQFERAFLVYELEGLPHWSSVVRRVNWQAPQGGFHAVHANRHGLQVEEISPDWLRQGRNELQFIVSDRNDLVGYTVKNLRVIGVPATGSAGARAQIDTPRADKVASALVDGSRETGLTNKDIRKTQSIDFRFAEASQPDSLLVAVDKGAKGTVTAQAIVRGKVDRASQTSADLDRLGEGWARIPLDSLPADVDGIRVTLRGAAGGESSGGLVSELRVTGSRLPTRRVSQMTITYPLHGECIDGEAYVRGFLRGDATGSTKGAKLRIGGVDRTDALKWDGSFSAVVKPPGTALRSGNKWQIELESSFANGDATGAVVDVEGCKEPVVAAKKTGPVEDVGAPFGQVVRAGEAAKLAFAGATLEIPAGALDGDTRITIRPIADIDIPATDETLTNVTAGGRAYRLGPHGLKFAKAINLTIPFDRSRFVGGQAEDDMGAYFFDDEAKKWRQVQTLRGDASKQMLTAATNHFSDFIAGTISNPDHPTADSFNPNAIKDMKAADPAAGIDVIQPPQPSPDGAAHLSFPLWVPPGRQGLQPSLAATYSSDAGNGWLGVGWDVAISSIQVDTRFGVPAYDPKAETETYSLDGELLVADPSPTPRTTRTFFHRRAEGKFDTIIRSGPGPIENGDSGGNSPPNAYVWEVIDKRGTHYTYGEFFEARASISGGVFRWYLSRVRDAFGNQIIYHYNKQVVAFHGVAGVGTLAVEIHPSTILYTADSAGQNAHYRIEFNLQTTSDGKNVIRADAFSDARGRTLSVTQNRLAHIQVFEGTNVYPNNVRRYDFNYQVGAFNKSLLSSIVVAQGRFPDLIDGGGNEFYRHSFGYYAFSPNPFTGRPAFESPVAWAGAPGNSGLSATDSNTVSGSVMGGWGPGGCALLHGVVGGSSSVDFPLPLPDFMPKTNEDNAQRGLLDVNGDGLPDLVERNAAYVNQGRKLRSFQSVSAFGVGDLVNHAPRSTVGLNTGVHALLEAVHVGAGRTWSNSGSDRVLADIDGDGFVDYLRSSGSFTLNLGAGFNTPVLWGMAPAGAIMPAEVVDLQKQQFTLADPTMQWTAPMSGHVVIRGQAQKTPNLKPTDGVRIFLESYHPAPTSLDPFASTRTSTWSQALPDQTPCEPPDLPATAGCRTSGPNRRLCVAKGDRIYFRASAIDEIDDDRVNWDPVIEYQDLTDDVCNNAQPVTGSQLALPEPFSGAAFAHVQGGDLRLAGKPIPLWRSDSATGQPVTVRVTGDIVKQRTSDDVTITMFKIPAGSSTAQIVLFPSLDPSINLTADFAGTVSIGSIPIVVAEGDRLYFQIASQSPIDASRVSWPVHVEYTRFCRVVGANGSTKTVFCGDVTGCTSSAGGGQCQLANDPNANQGSLNANVIRQDMPAYYPLIPWRQVGAPVGFIPPSNGQLTFTGTYVGPSSPRVLVRGLNRLYFQGGLDRPSGTPNAPTAPVTINVTAGDAVLFDAFVTTQDALVGTQDPAAWRVNVQFNGSSGIVNQTIFARRNYAVRSTDDFGAGKFHGWSVFEWNGSLPFSDNEAQKRLAQGFPDRVSSTQTNGATSVRNMRQAPAGVVRTTGTLPGPLWLGAGVDDYIGPGFLKPSRMGKPVAGSAVRFSSADSESSDSGLQALLGIAHDDSSSNTKQMLIDMNGDRYPDIVTSGEIRFSAPIFDDSQPKRRTTSGQFSGTPLKITLNDDLQHSKGHHVTASIGISSPTAAYIKGVQGAEDVPGWVSSLPSLGIGYGHMTTLAELLDINGDGLPDHVTRSESGTMLARLNLGYGFSDPVPYGQPTWEVSGLSVPQPTVTGQNMPIAPNPATFTNSASSVLNDTNRFRSDTLRLETNAANNVGVGYAWFGGNATASVTRTLADMIDINGDGLPDMVWRVPGGATMSVKLNQGDIFGPEQFWEVPAWNSPSSGLSGFIEQLETIGFGADDALAFTEAKGLSGSVGYSYYQETGIAGCWGVEAGAGGGQTSTGSEMRLQDIDGDGAPDYVLKLANKGVFVRRNPAAGLDSPTPNLLLSVTNPLGGAFSLNYKHTGHVVDPANHVDMPHDQLALTAIVVASGFAGDTLMLTIVDYSLTPSADPLNAPGEPSGFYSRDDREFLGYGHLTITRLGDGLQTERNYDNSTYAARHLLREEITRDTAGGPRLFRRVVNTYSAKTVIAGRTGSVFPAMTSQKTSFYEGLTNDLAAPVKSTTLSYDYDPTGNVKQFDDLGDDALAVPSDDVHYFIDYKDIADPLPNVKFPRAQSVTACRAKTPPCGAADTLRRRDATYGSRGEMLTLADSLFGGKEPTTGQPYVLSVGPTTNPTWGFTYDPFGNLQTSTDPNLYKLTYTYEGTGTHIETIVDSFDYKSRRVYDMKFGALLDVTDINNNRQHFDHDLYGRVITTFAPQDIGALAPAAKGDAANATVAFDFAIANIPGTTLGVAPFWARSKHKDAAHPEAPTDTLDTIVFVDGMDRVRQTKTDATVVTDGRIHSGRVTFDQLGRAFQEGFPTFVRTADDPTPTTFKPFPNMPFAKTFSYDVLGRVRAIRTPDDKGTTLAPDGAKVVTTLIDYNAKPLLGVTQLAKTVQDPQGKLRTQYLSPRQEILGVSEQNRLGTSNTLTVLTTQYTYDPLSQLTQVQDATGNITTAGYDSLGHMVLLKSPDAGQTEWRYDVAGKLAAKETANLRQSSKLVKYTYDVNRLKTIVYPTASELVTYTYGPAVAEGAANPNNQAGRITSVKDESGLEVRIYDALGNVRHSEKTPTPLSPSIPGVTYKMDYLYDPLGRVLSMKYPDGEDVSYGYDAGGSVKSVSGKRGGVTTNYVSSLSYTELGQRSLLSLGNGFSTQYFYYTDTKRLFNLQTTRGTAKVQDIGYGYDLVGNITGVSNNLPTLPPVAPNTVIAPGPTFQTFGYDDLYQLTSASGRYTGCACGCGNTRNFTLTMQYDGLGNITHKTQNDAINQPSGTSTIQVATSYDNGYAYSTRPHAPTGVAGTTISYDADGNQTQYSGSFGPSRSLTWSADDRLRSETDSGFTTSFLYDAAGERTHKRRTTLETWYVNPLYVVKNSLTESKHIMLGDARVVTEVATLTNRADPTTAGTSTLFYYHPDHLQSSSYVTAADGSILQHDEYFPTGEVWLQEQKNNDARNTQPYLFNAKELDETGLYYFGARYYNPKLSIWTSPDPILEKYMAAEVNSGVYAPRNLGLYSYSWNNPVTLTDPVGLAPVCSADQCRSVEAEESDKIAFYQRFRRSQGLPETVLGPSTNNPKWGSPEAFDDPKAKEISQQMLDALAEGQTGVPGFGNQATTDNDQPSQSATLAQLLKDQPALLDELRTQYKTNPEWQGIDPDNTQVSYRNQKDVAAIRRKAGENGGHHPHGLALGGPRGQKLTPTGDTKFHRNQKHIDATTMQQKIIRLIKPVKR